MFIFYNNYEQLKTFPTKTYCSVFDHYFSNRTRITAQFILPIRQ